MSRVGRYAPSSAPLSRSRSHDGVRGALMRLSPFGLAGDATLRSFIRLLGGNTIG